MSVPGVIVCSAPAVVDSFFFWNSAILTVGDGVELRFRGIDARPDTCELLLDYLDVSGRPYVSIVFIGRYTVSDGRQRFDVLRMTRTQLLEGQSVTPWSVPAST